MPRRWQTIIMLAAMLTFGCLMPTESYYDTRPTPPQAVSDAPSLGGAFEIVLEALESTNLSPAENVARNAAVKVIRPFEDGHGSGAYAKMHGRFIVITAAHVVEGCTTMIVEGRESERLIGRVIYADLDADLALILVPQMETRIALPYRARKSNRNLLGTRVTYTGFPGRHDLLTIRGHVASLEHDMVVTNMFGWFGASGSAVLDQQGRFVGVVSGIDVGDWIVPIPLHNIVWVAPIWELDKEIVEIRIKTEPPLEIFKSFPGARAPRRGTARD